MSAESSRAACFVGNRWESIEFDDLPGAAPTRQAHIYAVAMTTGVVKVGRSTNPRSRMLTHQRAADAHLVRLERLWVSEPIAEDRTFVVESELKRWARNHAESVRQQEYFVGVSFTALVAQAISRIGRRDHSDTLLTIGQRQEIPLDEAFELLGLADGYDGNKAHVAGTLSREFGLPLELTDDKQAVIGSSFVDFCLAAAGRYVLAAATKKAPRAANLDGRHTGRPVSEVLLQGAEHEDETSNSGNSLCRFDCSF